MASTKQTTQSWKQLYTKTTQQELPEEREATQPA